MPTARVVLFDLDDTLFDHSYSVRASLSALREADAALARWPLDDLVLRYQTLLDEVHERVLRGLVTPDEARIERFQGLFALAGVTIAPEDAVDYAHRHRAAYQEARRPVPGAVALLEYLQGRVSIGIVTNNLTAEQEEKLAVTGMDLLIDFLVTSEDAGSIKPDPGIFQAALSRAGCTPEEAVMVGDSWAADIEGALRAGLHAVWFNRGALPPPEPGLVDEIHSLEPVEAVATVLLGCVLGASPRSRSGMPRDHRGE